MRQEISKKIYDFLGVLTKTSYLCERKFAILLTQVFLFM